MAFRSMKLKSNQAQIALRAPTTAYSFMVHMQLSDQNKPHWQMARQAINNVCASDASEIQAWQVTLGGRRG